MSKDYCIYCDESTHLENDKMPYMVLGAIKCPKDKIKLISKEIKEIKTNFGFHPNYEVKWVKISKHRVDFYDALINYFFNNKYLSFRSLVANKSQLSHTSFQQTHNEWYYKMYYQLLIKLIEQEINYSIYLDIKDTLGAERLIKLKECIGYKHNSSLVKLQLIRSHESHLIQLTDLLIGAINYKNRGLKSNYGKLKVIENIENRISYTLKHSTSPNEKKFNLFHWKGGAIS